MPVLKMVFESLVVSQTAKLILLYILTIPNKSLVAISEGYTYQWIKCDNNNKIIEGANDHRFTPDQYGYYAVIITNGSYSTTSDCITLTTLDIDNLEDSILNVVLYPNPVESSLQIDVGNDYSNYSIEIFDILGKRIQTSSTKGKITTINTKELSSGIYIIRFVGEHKSVSKRFIRK